MNPESVSPFRNGEAIFLEVVPTWDMPAFRAWVLASVKSGRRLVAFFGDGERGKPVRLLAVLADDAAHTLSVASVVAAASYPALTPECPQAHLFEREVWEDFSLTPLGHPWLKPVRSHGFETPGQALASGESYRYFAVRGRGTHEVAVGPVHAGVIEPGHFRFQCNGEQVQHLEIQLGYQHRGMEKAFFGGPHPRTMGQMEVIAGDTTIGHAWAYCQAMEALSGTEAPPRAQALRAVALELERLANHAGDLGALSEDVGFLPSSAYCGRLRGDFLNMLAILCGSRLGRGFVRPGGTGFDLTPEHVAGLLRTLAKASRDLESAVELLFSTPSVQARFDRTGPVTADAAMDLGFVGLAARAVGLARDARADHPWGWYRQASPAVSTWLSGDVMARARVRWLEAQRSVRFIQEVLADLPPGAVRTPLSALRPGHLAVAMTEGWRGEIIHVAVTDKEGRFQRYKVVDPSFHNWMALALSMREQQISDFPLCNKSFNLSYCGFDL